MYILHIEGEIMNNFDGKALNLKVNGVLNIDTDIDIISVPKKKKISLVNEFKNYKGKNLAKDFSWDKCVGKEILSLLKG